MPPAAALKGLFAGGMGLAGKAKAVAAAKGLLAAGAGAMGFTTYRRSSETMSQMQSKIDTLQAALEHNKQEQQTTRAAAAALVAGAALVAAGGALYFVVFGQKGDLATVMTASRDSWSNLKHAVDEGVRRMYALAGPHLAKPGRLASRPRRPSQQQQQQQQQPAGGSCIIASAGAGGHHLLHEAGGFRGASMALTT